MKSQGVVSTAAEEGRVDFLMRKRSGQQSGIPREVGLEQVDASAVYGHGRCVRELDSTRRDELQAPVLALWIAIVGLQQGGYRSERVALRIDEIGTQLQEEVKPGYAERLARPHHGAGHRPRAHGKQSSRRVDAALHTRPLEGALEVHGAEAAH